MNITGQCHCGAISFTALIDSAKIIACHCADRQTFSGAPALVENVKLSGTPKLYIKAADSGNKRAQFAPTIQIWGNSAMPWLKTLHNVPHHQTGAISPLVKGLFMPVAGVFIA